jgi:hypothetical protein
MKPLELEDSLSPSWEKRKIGVTSFVKTALDYIPKGLVLSAAFTGGMMLLGNLTGWGILSGVTNLDMGGFVSRVLTTVGYRYRRLSGPLARIRASRRITIIARKKSNYRKNCC